MTVQEAQSALDGAVSKKNATDSALVDALAREKELSGQLGRLLADSAPTVDVLAVRQDRDAARATIEDQEAALKHLTADVATARQVLHQTKVAAGRAILKAEAKALREAG